MHAVFQVCHNPFLNCLKYSLCKHIGCSPKKVEGMTSRWGSICLDFGKLSFGVIWLQCTISVDERTECVLQYAILSEVLLHWLLTIESQGDDVTRGVQAVWTWDTPTSTNRSHSLTLSEIFHCCSMLHRQHKLFLQINGLKYSWHSPWEDFTDIK